MREAFVARERNFTRDASHELRTPLTVIRVASDLMQSDPDLPERAHRSLARIQRAGRDMEAVIDAFLLLDGIVPLRDRLSGPAPCGGSIPIEPAPKLRDDGDGVFGHRSPERSLPPGPGDVVVVEPADVLSAALTMAERIAANAPLSVAAAKRTVHLSAPEVSARAGWSAITASGKASGMPCW